MSFIFTLVPRSPCTSQQSEFYWGRIYKMKSSSRKVLGNCLWQGTKLSEGYQWFRSHQQHMVFALFSGVLTKLLWHQTAACNHQWLGPFHHSFSSKDKLHDIDMIWELPYCVILQNVSTNLNSSYYVFKGCLNSKKAKKFDFKIEPCGKYCQFSVALTTKCRLQRK